MLVNEDAPVADADEEVWPWMSVEAQHKIIFIRESKNVNLKRTPSKNIESRGETV